MAEAQLSMVEAQLSMVAGFTPAQTAVGRSETQPEGPASPTSAAHRFGIVLRKRPVPAVVRATTVMTTDNATDNATDDATDDANSDTADAKYIATAAVTGAVCAASVVPPPSPVAPTSPVAPEASQLSSNGVATPPLVALRLRRSTAALRLQAAFGRHTARRARAARAHDSHAPVVVGATLAAEVRAAEEDAIALAHEHAEALAAAAARAESAERVAEEERAAAAHASQRAEESHALCTELDTTLDETRARLQATTAEWAKLQAKYATAVVDEVVNARVEGRSANAKVARRKTTALATRTNRA